MSDRTQIEQTLRAAYAARQGGDIDGIMQCFAAHPTFQLAGAAHASPVAMRIEGAAPFRAAIQQLIATFIIDDYDIRTILIDGDRAAVQWRATFRSTVTGDVLKSDLFDLIETKDGRIVSMVEFCDTAAAAQLMGHKANPATNSVYATTAGQPSAA